MSESTPFRESVKDAKSFKYIAVEQSTVVELSSMMDTLEQTLRYWRSGEAESLQRCMHRLADHYNTLEHEGDYARKEREARKHD